MACQLVGIKHIKWLSVACAAACDWKSGAFQGRRRSQHALCRPACDPHSPQPAQYCPCLHPGVSKLPFERGTSSPLWMPLQFVFWGEIILHMLNNSFCGILKSCACKIVTYFQNAIRHMVLMELCSRQVLARAALFTDGGCMEIIVCSTYGGSVAENLLQRRSHEV